MGLNETVNFVDPDGNGLVSKVVVFEPEKEIKFAFLGEINDGKYVEVAAFADMLEHYIFEPVGDQTRMLVDVAMDDQYYDMMNEMWDRAGIELVRLSKQESLYSLCDGVETYGFWHYFLFLMKIKQQKEEENKMLWRLNLGQTTVKIYFFLVNYYLGRYIQNID